MKILIVDDSPSKFAEIQEVIRERVPNASVVVAETFVDAMKILSSEDELELLILDIFLPMRRHGVASSSVGLDILSEIVDGGTCVQPNHIVCLSEFCEDEDEIRQSVANRLVHLVDYRAGGSDWREKLEAKLEYILKRIETRASSTRSYTVDLAIITASPEVEISALFSLPCEWTREYCPVDEIVLFRSVWSSEQRTVNVVLVEAPTMGMTAASVVATKLIQRERPRLICMCGILAGAIRELNFGDVIVGCIVYDYGSGKILCDTQGHRHFLPDPQQITIDSGLQAVLREWEVSQRAMDEIGKTWYGMVDSVIPRLRLGVIASGSAVVQDGTIVENILSKSRKTLGIDMEAYGVAQAAKLCGRPKPLFLIAKSVCDYADSEKGDSAQRLAAFTSARFVFEFFRLAESIPGLD